MNFLDECAYELRFTPLRADAVSVSFPCDDKGRVQLDALTERARDAYLFARAVVGCQYARPVIKASTG